jgi:hypothetical protein
VTAAMYKRFKKRPEMGNCGEVMGDTNSHVSDGVEECADSDWKSVSHSQSAAEPAQTSASFKEITLESPSPARSPAVKSPQSSQRSDRIADSLPSSYWYLQNFS